MRNKGMARLASLLPPMILILLALAVIGVGAGYRVGTLTAMGPGFVPVMCGVLLLLLAGATLAGQWRALGTDPFADITLRPLLCAGGSVLLWGLAAEPLGLLPASLGQILLASLAVPGVDWRAALLLGVCVSLAAWALFVLALGVPLQAFG